MEELTEAERAAAWDELNRVNPPAAFEGRPCICGHHPINHRLMFGTYHCMDCDPLMNGQSRRNDWDAVSLSDKDSYVGAAFHAAEHDYQPVDTDGVWCTSDF